MKNIVILLLIAFAVSACYHRDPLADPNVLGLTGDYSFRELTRSEKEDVIKQIKSAEGVKYVWGGQSFTDGVDCSGLLVWSYAMLGYSGFRKDDTVVYDLTSNDMSMYDVDHAVPVTDNAQLLDYEMGDFLFFDVNADGRVDHVAVFMHYDPEKDAVWVWDASTNTGRVAYREFYGFLKKNPKIGRPVKPVRNEIPADCTACAEISGAGISQ
ncbi:MAG: NlpC/P60 family protein [Deferribacterales bacterium]